MLKRKDSHTCEVSKVNPGVTAASKMPKKNRMATAPPKFDTPAKHARMNPHRMMEIAEYFPSGMR